MYTGDNNVKKRNIKTRKKNPNGLEENRKIARKGGNVYKVARNQLESELSESVISKNNNLNYEYKNKKEIENK